jgi:hypothetical protein
VGSQESDRWEMNIFGPNSFERSYTLEGSAGEHDPRVVGSVIAKIVPATGWAQKESFGQNAWASMRWVRFSLASSAEHMEMIARTARSAKTRIFDMPDS